MIAEFLAWYGQQMQDMVSGLNRRRTVRPPDGWVVSAGPVLTASRIRNGRATAPVPLDDAALPSGAPVTLALPSERVLVRDVRVPAAAAANLPAVLAFDMDRLTPFTADSVVWDHDVTGQDRARSELLVRLHLLPRARLAPVLDALAGGGLTVTAVLAAGRRMSLLPPDPERQARQRRLVMAAGALCAGLAAAAVATPMLRVSMALDDAADDIARLRPLAAKADALRKQINGEGAADTLAQAKQRAATALRVVAALTAALPDDTYLTSLTLKGSSVTVEGQSAAATKLIGAISSQSGLQNPSFSAPVVRTEQQTEIFAIQASAGS